MKKIVLKYCAKKKKKHNSKPSYIYTIDKVCFLTYKLLILVYYVLILLIVVMFKDKIKKNF